VISGECHVEGIPGPGSASPGDRRLILDGLRLRLDLRIVPGAPGSDAAAAAIWRIESDGLSTLPLCAPSTYRRLAVGAGIAALALAVGMWFLGSPVTPTDARWASEPSEQTAGAVRPGIAAPGSAEAAPSAPASASRPVPADASVPGSADGNEPAAVRSPTAAPALTPAPSFAEPSAPERQAVTAPFGRPQTANTPEPESARGAVTPRITVLPPDAASIHPVPVDERRAATAGGPSAVPPRLEGTRRVAPVRGTRPPAAASRLDGPTALTSDAMLDLFSDTK
jgi:hypothetical protein